MVLDDLTVLDNRRAFDDIHAGNVPEGLRGPCDGLLGGVTPVLGGDADQFDDPHHGG
jgi:hypothetical protein